MAKDDRNGTRKPHDSNDALAESRTRVAATPDNNIRNWRLFRGIQRQEDLAQMSGVPRPTIVRLESGELRYNQDHVKALSSALRCSPRDLIGTNPFDAGDIFAVYAGLSDADKRKALKLLATLKR